jgi:hypothetical protein
MAIYSAFSWQRITPESGAHMIVRPVASIVPGWLTFVDPTGSVLVMKAITAPPGVHFPQGTGQVYMDRSKRIYWSTSAAAPAA